jgi:PAS domain S-box-containing protein
MLTALCVLWGLFGLWAHNLQENRRHTMEQVLDHQRVAMQEHVSSVFTITETFLAMANRWVIDHPDRDARNDPEFAALVRDFQKVNNKSLTFRLVDADGSLNLIPPAPGSKPANVADRDYFVGAMAKPPGAITVSTPYVGRSTGHTAIAVATRLSNPSHGLAIAYVAIELEMLEQTFAKARINEGGAITLIRRDGVILARSASTSLDLGKNIAGSQLFLTAVEKSDEGVAFSNSAATDGIPRLIAYGVLPNYPLVVTVGASIDGIMAESRGVIARVAALLLLGSALLLLSRWKIVGLLDDLAASRSEIERSRDDLTIEVAERRQVEEALQRSESDLRAILDNMTDVFYRTDDQGRLTMVSRSMEALLGYGIDEILGHDVAELHFDHDGRPKFLEAIAQNGGIISDYQFRLRHKQGHPVWVAASARCLQDAQGHIGKDIEGVCRDISESRAQLEEIQRSNAELEQFAYVASHDLREPLRMISSYLSLLERRSGENLSEDGLEFLAFARDGAKRMDRLVLDLLDYSRIGRRGDALEPMAVLPALELAKGHLALAITDSEARLSVAPNLSQPMVLGDQGQIVRLFQNLIGNALKYRSQSRRPEIAITCRRKGNLWEFTVADNGIGIDSAYFERIFGLFQRLHTHENFEGTGIGLAVCKKIVERHGGSIWLDSVPGQGSRFHFTLPVTNEA